jgi:hypothetical protein
MGVTAPGAVAQNAFSDEVVALLPHRNIDRTAPA